MDNPEARPILHLSLCTGYGGLDLGLGAVLSHCRPVAYCEREAFAVANLLAKIEQGVLEPAPIWTDLKTFPWKELCGSVDILSGGYPCQPFSKAGHRNGKEDPRHLWPWIIEGIRIVWPQYCFFENVEGHIDRGLQDVIDDLEAEGYKTAWGMFSAEEVGFPHQRRRVFILAKLADSNCIRLSDGSSEEHPAETRIYAQRKSWASNPYPMGVRPFAPARPGEPQHAGEPPRSIEPCLGGDADGSPGRMVESERQARLQMLGNGVVPLVDEKALWHLLNELN